MRAAWVIAAREVREKARLFVVCAALALVPFAATLLPGTRGNAEATIALVGGFLATVLGLGIAMTLGASTIVRDLAERRMSFYFTKPLSAPAIWLGKGAASLFISLACAAIIVTPAYLGSRRQWVMHWLGDVQPLVALAIAIVVTFFLAHVASSVIRSRSPLLALDFVFLVAAAGAAYLIVHPLFLGGAVKLIVSMQLAIGIAVLLVIAIAPVWQLANGRSDIRRSHAALMRFLWPAIAVVLLLAGGVVAWVVHVAPEDVAISVVEQSPRGETVIVGGTARNRFDYQAAFLVDRATGRFTRIAPPWWGSQFSGDGRVAAWLQPVGLFSMRGFQLRTTKGPTDLVQPLGSGFALSHHGDRVAFANGRLVTVYDLATGKLLASGAGLEGRARQQLFFATADVVRVIEHEVRSGDAVAVRVYELDVRARAMRKTADRTLAASRSPVSVSGDGTRMFIRGANVIADGRTAETLAQVNVSSVAQAAMLHDGRLALITREGQVPHLRTFERDGAPRHDLAFPDAQSIWIAAETDDGKLILAAYGKTMVVVDLASGAVERTLPGIRGPVPRWSADPRLPRFAADQELAGIDASGKLIVWKHEGRTGVRPLLRSR